jgi:hypothetical protein
MQVASSETPEQVEAWRFMKILFEDPSRHRGSLLKELGFEVLAMKMQNTV